MMAWLEEMMSFADFWLYVILFEKSEMVSTYSFLDVQEANTPTLSLFNLAAKKMLFSPTIVTTGCPFHSVT